METTNAVMVLEQEWTQPLAASCVASVAPRLKLHIKGGTRMPHVEFDLETRLPPDRVVAALTDFSQRRPDIWPDLDRKYFEVYSVGPHSAEVREGSHHGPLKYWAKEHYEWSSDSVSWTATESSFCKPGSHMSVSIKPRGDGGSKLHVVWERRPSSAVGGFITTLVKLTHGKPLAKNLEQVFDKLAAKAVTG